MFFMDKNGEIVEGTPVTDEWKAILDSLKAYYHDGPVCNGYHPAYDNRCFKAAKETLKRFDVRLRADYVPELEPIVPEPVLEPLPVPVEAKAVVDDDIPF